MKGKSKTRESSGGSASGEPPTADGESANQRNEARRAIPVLREVDPQFDEKISALVDSFEQRIRKLRAHISDLEARISELRTSKDRVRTAFDEFLNIQQLSEMIRTKQDPHRVVEELLTLVHKFIEYDAMGIYLFNDVSGGLEPLGPVPQMLNRAARSQYDEGIIDWVISERRPVAIPWIESFGEEVAEPGKNLVIAPLIVDDRPLGVALLSTSRRPDGFTAQELKMLYFAVSHAAVAIQNALRTREISTTKDFLSNLLENAGDIIFSLDQNGRFNYLNPRIEDLGFTKDELLGQSFRMFFKQTETAQRINSTLRLGSKQVFELEMRTVARGVSGQYTVNLVPLKGEKGEKIGALGIMHNVTEINRLQKKLLESERLAAYTQTVITLNHEINNPLTAVLGNAYLLEKDSKDLQDEKLMRRLKVIQENCLRIQKVIKKLERIDELKTVSYLGNTKMVDIGNSDDNSRSSQSNKE